MYRFPFHSLSVERLSGDTKLCFAIFYRCAILEVQLVGSWQTQNRSSYRSLKSSNRKLETWKRRVFTIRAHMFVFIQQLLWFCTSEVIEPHWQSIMAKITPREDDNSSSTPTAHTVDELMEDHVNFLDTFQKERMLTNGRLLRVRSNCLSTL